MSASKQGTHILVIPYQAPGHMLPLLDLTHQLSIRGLTITILVTPKNLPLLNSLLYMNPSIQTLVLPFPPHPSIPAGVENMQELPIEIVAELIGAMCEFYKPVLHWFQNHPSPPVAIISDIFHSSWTQALACDLGIKRVGFGPVNSCPLYKWWTWWSGKSNVNECKVEATEPVVDNCVANVESWGIILNTFNELESEHLTLLKKELLKHDRVWAVGPLLPIEGGPMGLAQRGGPSSVPIDEVLMWLDSCPVDKSVVYVGFGSQITLTKRQMEALAVGLELSGVRFIWSVKGPMKGVQSNDHYSMIIPSGFQDRVAGRGLVIRGWAPQVAILKHRAVGAYLTHCGWNSALEGLLNEVLLLAWPMQADHYFNTELLVDELGVAIRACEGLHSIPESVNLARILSESVSERTDLPERARALELREKALNAIKEGGSSFKALDGLVKALSALNPKLQNANKKL